MVDGLTIRYTVLVPSEVRREEGHPGDGVWYFFPGVDVFRDVGDMDLDDSCTYLHLFSEPETVQWGHRLERLEVLYDN